MARPAGLKALLAHRSVLVALSRHLVQDHTGGSLSAAMQMLVKVLGLAGTLAYRTEGGELVLVSEERLPRRARAWLAHLPLDDEPWFVAQRVADSRKIEVDDELAASRGGVSLRPALEEAGWRALAAAPMTVGRDVLGVLVMAAGDMATFDKDTLALLEAVAGMLALATHREKAVVESRYDKAAETENAQLATMGLLASSVARDISAPLTSVSLHVERHGELLTELKRELGNAIGNPAIAQRLADVEELVGDMGEVVRHVEGITSRLLTFSRETQPEPIDLGQLMNGAATLLRGNFTSRGIALEVAGLEEEIYTEGRIESLQMLVVQMLLYAAQEAVAGANSAPSVVLVLEAESNSCVITVETGARAKQRSSSQIFDNLMKGSRATVSLELAKQIAVMHKGHVEIGNTEAGGVMVRVVLPASEQMGGRLSKPRTFHSMPPMPAPDTAPDTEPAEASAPASGKPCLLWVDDDAKMARAMARYIKSHDTHVAGSLAEARTLLTALDPPPEVVLCSVTLPDGLGTALHQEQDLQLAGRFVFVTGGVLAEEVASYLKASGCATLIKPLTVAEIQAVLGADVEAAPYAHTLAQEEADSLIPDTVPDDYRGADADDDDDHPTPPSLPRPNYEPLEEDYDDDTPTPPPLRHSDGGLGPGDGQTDGDLDW